MGTRWNEVKPILTAARQLSGAELRAYLDQECAEDAELRREVEAYLAADTGKLDFLDDPPVELTRGEEPDQRIGPYCVVRELGRGGTGAVYLASRDDEEFQHEVAIKVLKRGMDTDVIVRRFQVERQILANLKHPYIARLYDGGSTADGRPYFVMEYIAGVPIERYCDGQQLNITERLRLFRRVCSAVEVAHQNLVVHRDLKPGNILVTTSGEPRLLDFGIAKILDPEDSSQSTTLIGPAFTPAYASPEQVTGQIITTASDVYSLGVVLYELLTGHRPYEIDSSRPEGFSSVIATQPPIPPSTAVIKPRQMAKQDGSQETISAETLSRCRKSDPRKLRNKLGGDLETILLKALRKNPQRRYASVEQLSEDIRLYLGRRPIKARRDSLLYRTDKFVRRNPIGIAIAATFLLLLSSFAVAMTWQQQQTALQRDRAEEIASFLQEIFETSDPYATNDGDVTARQLLSRATERIATDLEEVPELRASLSETIGMIHLNLGLYEEAEPLLQEGVELQRQLNGEDSLEYASSLNNLGSLFVIQRKDELAEQTLRESLSIQHNPDTLVNLGRVLRHRGKLDEAESSLQEAVAIFRSRDQNPTDELADALANLGNVSISQGKYAQAEQQYRQSLELFQQLWGQEHSRVARLLHNLAYAVEYQGQYQEARDLYVKALAMTEKFLGDEHPGVGSTANSLAALYVTLGDYSQAEALYQRAIDNSRKNFEAEHPRTARRLNNFAELMRTTGRFEEAKDLYQESLAIRRKVLGDDHAEVAGSLNNLGFLSFELGQHEESERLITQAITIWRQHGDNEEHPTLIRFRNNLALVFQATGRFSEAESLWLQCLDASRRTLGRHRLTAQLLRNLAGLLLATGDAENAETYVSEARDIFRELLPEGNWQIADAESVLGGALLKLERFDEAEELLVKSYPIISAARSPRSRNAREARQRLFELEKTFGGRSRTTVSDGHALP